MLNQTSYLSKFLDKVEFYKLDKAFFADEMQAAFHIVDFLGVNNTIIGFVANLTNQLIFPIPNNSRKFRFQFR